MTAPLSPPSLRNHTAARVALRRTGVSLATNEVLDLELSHAQARDAIHAPLDPAAFADRLRTGIPTLQLSTILTLASAAPDRSSYLRRPDLGRTLSSASVALLFPSPCDIAIVIADGLSAPAIENHSIPLLTALLPMLAEAGLTVGPISIVTQARVAIADEIAAHLQARLSLILIGERPGLSSFDSLGAYITWNPAPGRNDAERNCISNIRTGGLDYAAAAHRILYLCTEACRRQLTGTALKDPTQHLLQP